MCWPCIFVSKFVSILTTLMATNVWGYTVCPCELCHLYEQGNGYSMSLKYMCSDEPTLMGLTTAICWFIYHLQPCLTVLTASRVKLLFNLQTRCLKPRLDVISCTDCLSFFYFTRLPPLQFPNLTLLNLYERLAWFYVFVFVSPKLQDCQKSLPHSLMHYSLYSTHNIVLSSIVSSTFIHLQ